MLLPVVTGTSDKKSAGLLKFPFLKKEKSYGVIFHNVQRIIA
jgi:hypothetical protein